MNVYKTTYDREIPIEPISILMIQRVQTALMEQYKEGGVELDPPKYCVELPSGAEQCYEHDADTIADAKTSDEDKEAWKIYQENTRAFNSEANDRILGVMIVDQPVEYDEGWEKKYEWLGIRIPEDEMDKKMLYFTTHLLKSASDIKGFMAQVVAISLDGVDEDAVTAAKNMFSSS